MFLLPHPCSLCDFLMFQQLMLSVGSPAPSSVNSFFVEANLGKAVSC